MVLINFQQFNGILIDQIFILKELLIKSRVNMKALWLLNLMSEVLLVKLDKDLRPERISMLPCNTTIICGWFIIFSILNKSKHFIISVIPMNFPKWK